MRNYNSPVNSDNDFQFIKYFLQYSNGMFLLFEEH